MSRGALGSEGTSQSMAYAGQTPKEAFSTFILSEDRVRGARYRKRFAPSEGFGWLRTMRKHSLGFPGYPKDPFGQGFNQPITFCLRDDERGCEDEHVILFGLHVGGLPR